MNDSVSNQVKVNISKQKIKSPKSTKKGKRKKSLKKYLNCKTEESQKLKKAEVDLIYMKLTTTKNQKPQVTSLSPT